MTTERRLLNGNEAVAWAALDAGVDYFSHYPGSPVNFVEPALKQLAKTHRAPVYFNDALNEHIATLAAAGASFCGARSLVVMKHVGMNIAADPLNYVGYAGVKGGMVVVVGTDPGANVSTGEEDTHWYVPQINAPLFEPTTVREIYDQIKMGFSLSEQYHLPILVFVPAQLCYNADFLDVPTQFEHPFRVFHFDHNPDQYINAGHRAVLNHRGLLERVALLGQETAQFKIRFNPEADVGLVTRGLAYACVFEAVNRLGIEDRVHMLNLDLVYPLPKEILRSFFKGKTEVVFVEDQDGFLECMVKMHLFNDISCEVYGKDIFPPYGDIQLQQVEDHLAEKFGVRRDHAHALPVLDQAVPERLGTFCEGCPHRATYFGIDRALEDCDGVIGGDIGCSSLPPFRADWLLCMNAGIGISQGMSQVLEEQFVVSTGGDGSFFHGGLLSLQSAVQNGLNLLHLVFDNRTIAMTGHQASPTSGSQLDWRQLLTAIGVAAFVEVSAFDPLELAKQIKRLKTQTGVRVIWVTGDCALMPSAELLHRRRTRFLEIENEKCGSCSSCYTELACPAIVKKHPGLWIDMDSCHRCGACLAICPNNAIKIGEIQDETV